MLLKTKNTTDIKKYLEKVNILLDNLTINPGISDDDISNIDEELKTLKEYISSYSDIRTYFGKPDTNGTFILFNLSSAYTPEGKIIRCIAEIEDRLLAILDNYKNIKDDVSDINTRSTLIYFKAAVDKLLFIIKEIEILSNKYNIDLKTLNEKIEEISTKEKIYSIIDSIIINSLTGNELQVSNNLELLFKIGIDPRIVINNVNIELQNNNIIDYNLKLEIINKIYNKIEPYIKKYNDYHS